MITITESGKPSIDVSRRLIADSDIELTQERERDAFERVISDVKLSLGNIDGTVADLFSSTNPLTYWDVNIYDGRCIFWGRVQSPITFKLKTKVVEVRVYSIDRTWIDLCNVTYIPMWKYTNKIYTTLEDILHRVLIGEGRPMTEIGISEIVVDDVYKNRPIRDTKDSDDSTIGNYGKFSDLDTTTTVKELLDAISIYYNAEFFVDPETKRFIMKQRSTVISDTEHDLDAVIRGDNDIDVDDTDQKRYDFIKVSIGVPKPGTPEKTDKLIPVKLETNASGTFPVIYKYTNVVKSGGIEIETELSDAFVMEYKFVSVMKTIWLPIFKIAQPPTGTVRQNIYRLRLENENWFELYTSVVVDSGGLLVINPKFEFDLDVVLRDWTPITQSGRVGNEWAHTSPSGDVFLRYDEFTGLWDDNIVEAVGTPAPKVGVIFEVNPQLRFYGRYSYSVKPFSIVDSFYFFGAETNMDAFKTQWLDMFRLRKPLRCTVKGTNYKYGDSFVSHRAAPGKYYVKKAVGKFMKKETELELVTV